MGSRLPGFDYTRPFYYMVTVGRAAGFPEMARVVDDPAAHYIEANAITRLFVDIIKTFHETWYCIEPITCFSIMPDHIHLLIKLRDSEKRVSLPVIVRMLTRALEKAYFAAGLAAGGAAAGQTLTVRGEDRAAAGETLTVGGEDRAAAGKRSAVGRSVGQHFFAFDWHDWIVMREGQLAAFTRYIRENPERSWRRHSHRAYFQRVGEIDFLGRKWFGYGNAALLRLPVLEPFQCSRKWAENGPEWQVALARAERLGPGCAGISTFMSPCEKACGHTIGLAGGRWIVLSPEGFGERWHPGREYEKFCAEGRMLFLSLWPAQTREPTKAELYARCHQMGDIVIEGLGGPNMPYYPLLADARETGGSRNLVRWLEKFSQVAREI